MRALAAVFAHPDDETFAMGGTLAKHADAGARVSLYCATDGDAGRASGIPFSSREELGRIRRAELLEACARLGVHDHDTLLWLSLVTIELDGTITVNLRAPVVINPAAMVGHQVVPYHCVYPIRYVVSEPGVG